MNLNLVVVTGRLTVEPEESTPASGAARLLLTVASGAPPGRVDLLPVVASSAALPDRLVAGTALWVVGSLQRQFSQSTGRSRLEIVAHHVEEKPR